MALPLVFVPNGLPLWLVAGHSITPASVFDDVPMLVGHGRKRRVFTTAPRIATVALILEADEMVAFDDWYENTLKVGNERFTAEIANLGPGRVFWTAQWLEPYDAEPLHLGRWRVTCALLLTGTPSDTRPATGELALSVPIELDGSATAAAPIALVLSISIDLDAVTSLSLSVPIELISFAADYELRETGSGGGYELREDGSKELRD